jgi:hypothetical protein
MIYLFLSRPASQSDEEFRPLGDEGIKGELLPGGPQIGKVS